MALLAIGVFVGSAADAKVKPKHHYRPAPQIASAYRHPEAFPVYVDHGADRNPGGDNLYFTDTKNPHYVVGPAWFQRWEDR